MLLLPLEYEAVVLDELSDKEEGVDSGDAVADEAGNPFALGGIVTLDEQLSPQRRELFVVALQLGGEFFFTLLYFVERAVFVGGFLYGKHE